jgi:XTP/dITP diphosphohydrolase
MSGPLVFATHNSHKFREIQHAISQQIELLSLKDIGCTFEIPEDYDTLEANASQKALFIYNHYGLDCFADDTGLEIDALNGEPGVYSARYAGEKCSFDDNVNLVLEKMQGFQSRCARFITVISLIEKGNPTLFRGTVKGIITATRKGDKGFGYDPIFQPEGYNQTYAEMDLSQKNAISHRAVAVNKLVEYLLRSRSI